MTYYHIWIKTIKGKDYFEHDYTEDSLEKLVKLYKEGKIFFFDGKNIDPREVRTFRICKTAERYKSYMPDVWDTGKDVTKDFVHKSKKPKPLPKSIFIVHGTDHKPMKELKTMLKEFGLNPIVLHEQPSGSRTIVEKLEKYSDVGYAFVILTPDDLGGSLYLEETTIQTLREQILNSTIQISDHIKVKGTITEEGFRRLLLRYQHTIDRIITALVTKFMGKHRARQNVVLEFGYFIGLLSRDRVCCLYKGDIELPSDMHGIVYIPFKESVNEVRDKIIKELKEAGYELKM